MKIVGRLVDSAENVELEIKNGQIYSIVPQPAKKPSRTWISRPLIDIQINGFGGYDLNAENTTAHDVSQMVESVHDTGTGYLYPTIITGSSQRMAQAIAAIHQARQDRSIERAILAFISKVRTSLLSKVHEERILNDMCDLRIGMNFDVGKTSLMEKLRSVR